jgi:tRNA threonylcarbamoyladenosine biosynthesis protein TsaB
MIVLAIDTSSPLGSVAFVKDGRLLAEMSFGLKSHHSTHVLPAVEALGAKAGIGIEAVDLFACAKGPGSFTGLRIGIATCMGLATGSGKEIVGVSTLEAVAYPYLQAELPVASVLDARKGQVYFQLFEVEKTDSIKALSEAVSVDPAKLASSLSKRSIFVGDGVDLYRDLLENSCGAKALFPPPGLCYHRAHVVGIIGELKYRHFGSDQRVEPFYVRASDAEINLESKNE